MPVGVIGIKIYKSLLNMLLIFRWANSSYIQTLPTYEWLDTPANYVLDRRHNAEFWIGMNPKIKYKSFYTWNYSNLEGGERLLKAEYEIND